MHTGLLNVDGKHRFDLGSIVAMYEIAAVKIYDYQTFITYTSGITPKRVTNCEAHLRGLAPGLYCFEEMSQWWRAVGKPVSDLTCPGIEP